MSTKAADDLVVLADKAVDALARIRKPSLKATLASLAKASEEVGRAWSGSNIGYHAHVYCKDLLPCPPNVHFSSEWGLMDMWPTHQPSPMWIENDYETVFNETLHRAGTPDLDALERAVKPLREQFFQLKEECISVLTAVLGASDDKFIRRKLEQVERLGAPDSTTLLNSRLPKTFWSRDTLALSKGARAAPHQAVGVIADTAGILEGGLDQLEKSSREAASHLRRTESRYMKASLIGTNVFIGHGRSLIWRELKDFIEDRLGLPVDEFNSVPVAGISTVARLSDLIEAASFAFLIMTAEDEQADGKLNARLNVVHEVGLFQGRLGFSRAIVLLEDGCEEFSNIHGMGQIRFPKGNIGAKFEDIRAVLEREGLIERAPPASKVTQGRSIESAGSGEAPDDNGAAEVSRAGRRQKKIARPA